VVGSKVQVEQGGDDDLIVICKGSADVGLLVAVQVLLIGRQTVEGGADPEDEEAQDDEAPVKNIIFIILFLIF
jgi:hypothetical protein